MSENGYRLPLSTRLLRMVLRPIFRALFHTLSRVKITGKENIPAKGPYLIAINHISLFEPPFVLAFWPVAPEAAGAVDIWDRTGQAVLVRLYGGIPVHRGEYDRKLIDTLLGALKSGKPLMIAPEGGRSHSLGMRQALPGAAYLADQSGVPILPVGIRGTSDEFLKTALEGERPAIEMHIGRPMSLPKVQGKGNTRRAQRQANADLIMKKIAELLPPEYHGVYKTETKEQENLPGSFKRVGTPQ